MSGYKAIGAVSSTLRTLLLDRMEDQRPVTVAPPGVSVATVSGKRVNLFLYKLAENGFLKNQEIPGRGHPSGYGNPPLSLDLHYLVSVLDPDDTQGMTDTAEIESQEILGDAMRVLHDFAIVDSGLLKQRLTPAGPILDPLLLTEFEKVKLSLSPIGLEELTDVWSALSADFRLSVAYEVCVVQIESTRERQAVLPVLVRRVFVRTFRLPHVDEVFREPPINGIRTAAAAAGETLRIEGSNLSGTPSRVTLGGVDAPLVAPARDDQLDVEVPASLPIGVHPVQVVHDIDLGTPTEPHGAQRSNAVALLLVPTVVDLAPASPPGAAVGDPVTITVDPPVRAGQRVEVLLGDRVVPAQPVPPGTDPTPTVQFVLPGPAGTHLLRVRVAGAESRLTFDPATGTFTGPTYVVT
jgi:Pvc16 N-terminal domain